LTSMLESDGFIFFFLFPGLTAGDSITPQQPEVTETEGESVTLTCSYETTSSYPLLHWYRHHSDLQAPQFILWKQGKGGSAEYIPDKRYKSETSPTTTNLTIAALTLADTALYYCALQTQ
uniref:Ig-like domain-containing protein n=1 Tax=Astatotilapia calliptera TaxID=8154 RepID=A0A3P8QN29_ASTCA